MKKQVLYFCNSMCRQTKYADRIKGGAAAAF